MGDFTTNKSAEGKQRSKLSSDIADFLIGVDSNRSSNLYYNDFSHFIHGYNKHVTRNRTKQLVASEDNHAMPRNKKKAKSRNTGNMKNNYSVMKYSSITYDSRKKKYDDYLLKKRIEREVNPEKSFQRRNWWNMSLRENYTDEDYYKMHLKAQMIARKALNKEKRIMENISEKERLEQISEIDRMLINSLKAKIELINGL